MRALIVILLIILIVILAPSLLVALGIITTAVVNWIWPLVAFVAVVFLGGALYFGITNSRDYQRRKRQREIRKEKQRQ